MLMLRVLEPNILILPEVFILKMLLLKVLISEVLMPSSTWEYTNNLLKSQK